MTTEKVNITAVKRVIGRKLYKFNGIEHLCWAWNAQENLIMFGPGGYGKSDAAVLFVKYLKNKEFIKTDPYVFSLNQGTSEEKLLGGMDIKKFQQEGTIEYLLENAFVNYEVVIFEELWDAFPQVLLLLKDILTSKEVRMGTQTFPIKTKMVIACTNRSRDEVIEDASTEALLQRFAFEVEIKWDSWGSTNYAKAFEKALPNVDENLRQVVASICEKSSKKLDMPISPRTAVKALKSAHINGIQSLQGFHGFELGNVVKIAEKNAFFEKTYNDLRTLYEKARTSKSALKVFKAAKFIIAEEFKIKNESCYDENIDLKNKVLELVAEATESLYLYGKTLIINPKKNTLFYTLKDEHDPIEGLRKIKLKKDENILELFK